MVGRLVWGVLGPETISGELVGQIPIDPGGTNATIESGTVKITVPPGAVNDRQTISIYRQPVAHPVQAMPAGGGSAVDFPAGTLSTYVFAPTDIELAVPIEVTFTLPSDKDGLAYLTVNGKVRVLPGYIAGPKLSVAIAGFDFSKPGAVTIPGARQ